MKKIIFALAPALVIPTQIFADPAKDFYDMISSDEWREMEGIAQNIAASCTEKVFTDQSDLVAGVRRIVMDLAYGAVEVAADYETSQFMKKDYPNICHVMPAEILKNISPDSSRDDHPCIWKAPGGGCFKRETRTYKTYAYYWPKYFVEVSDKGNDPHPAFAADNKLYAADRKIASSIDKMVDVKGPYTIAAKVMAGAGIVQDITKTFIPPGVSLGFTGEDLARSAQTAVLTPFEKLRIRASHTTDQPTYEVNIWPVGLSKSMAERFGVCGDGNRNTDEGGFAWPVPGVAMTCPVAMARDAWSYWDSGMIDYLNPNAIRGIVSASNPMTCAADNFTSLAFDEIPAQGFGNSVGGSEGKSQQSGQVGSLPAAYGGLRACSFPITGDTEAVYSQYAQLPNSFKGPWCTLWGPMTPRNSTTTFRNDYAYVNAALKFKTLAHDIFGIPRGKKERWALAYPWEDSPQSFLGSFGSDLASTMGIDKNSDIFKKFFSDSGTGRSKMLMIPGDPRLIDSKISPVLDLASVEGASNLAKEAAYLASLNTAATAADKAAVDAMKKQYGVTGPSTSKDVLAAQEKDQAQTDQDTALLGKEPIYGFETYCHVSAENKGVIVGATDNSYPVKFQGNLSGSPYSFYPESDQGRCFAVDIGGCISRDSWGKCSNKRDGQYIFYKKAKITGYRDVQNPAIFEVQAGADCTVSSGSTPNTKFVKAICSDKIVKVGTKDTRQISARPDVNAPEKGFSDNPEAAMEVGLAARAATWVGAEIARAQYENMSGKSMLPGRKKVYTIFEQVTCEPQYYVVNVAGISKYGNCEEAVKFEIRKFVQTRLIRKACDAKVLFNSPLGKPFR